MGQTLNMPTLGIFFDIRKIEERVDSGNYLRGAWKVVWRAIGVENLRDYKGALLYECDVAGAETEACCVAIQSMHKHSLDKIQEVLARSAEFQLVARLPMFAGDSARSQPLMQAGSIDANGNVVGPDDYCSRPALEEVRIKGSEGVTSLLTVNIGDINGDYKVIALRKGWEEISIVLAQRANKSAPTNYVVWSFDGTCFKSGIYENDLSKAQAIFQSRTS